MVAKAVVQLIAGGFFVLCQKQLFCFYSAKYGVSALSPSFSLSLQVVGFFGFFYLATKLLLRNNTKSLDQVVVIASAGKTLKVKPLNRAAHNSLRLAPSASIIYVRQDEWVVGEL